MKFVVVVLMLCTSLAQAQYRNDMPEVIEETPAEDSLSARQAVSNQYPQPVSTSINRQYQQAGSPRILILLGRSLGNDLSEWQADTRDTISTMNRAYQGRNQAKDTRDTYRMTEDRKAININISPGMEAFYKGFSDYLQAANIGMLNYDSILRQAQRKNELSGNIDRSTDLREVEADAVLANVDILIEIIDAGFVDVLGTKVDKVQVNVTRMDTFETLSQHTGQGSEYYKIDEKWVAGSNGYEKQQTVLLFHADAGYEIADQLLPKVLSRPFSKVSGNINQLPGNPDPKAPVRKKKRVLPPKG